MFTIDLTPFATKGIDFKTLKIPGIKDDIVQHYHSWMRLLKLKTLDLVSDTKQVDAVLEYYKMDKVPWQTKFCITSSVPVTKAFVKALLKKLIRRVQGDAAQVEGLCQKWEYKFPTHHAQEFSWFERWHIASNDQWSEVFSTVVAVIRERKNKSKEEKQAAMEFCGTRYSDNCRLLMPDIGTEILLTQDWNFRLFGESRNEPLWKACDENGAKLFHTRDYLYGYPNLKSVEAVIKAGATLKIDRVYIHKGADDFSSVTFFLNKGAVVELNGKQTTMKKNPRFWAKLKDVNAIVCKVDMATLSEK
jgi:hypothetical protein